MCSDLHKGKQEAFDRVHETAEVCAPIQKNGRNCSCSVLRGSFKVCLEVSMWPWKLSKRYIPLTNVLGSASWQKEDLDMYLHGSAKGDAPIQKHNGELPMSCPARSSQSLF